MTADPGPPTRGFHNTRRRLVSELMAVAGALFVVVGVGFAVVTHLSGWLVSWVPRGFDETIGKQAWDAMVPTSELCTDLAPLRYVEELGQALLPHIDSEFEFQFRIADDPTINAFALPGGFITVNIGLLNKAGSGEEIAGVLAHEIAHVTLRHGTHRVLRQLGTATLLAVVFGGTDIEAPVSLLGGLLNTAYDRDQEAHADEVGLETLRRAGLDPKGMARFFERVASESSLSALPEVLSTHPDPGNRAQRAAEVASQFKATRSLPDPAGLACR
jgi:predicted Zn-dependent protease